MGTLKHNCRIAIYLNFRFKWVPFILPSNPTCICPKFGGGVISSNGLRMMTLRTEGTLERTNHSPQLPRVRPGEGEEAEGWPVAGSRVRRFPGTGRSVEPAAAAPR